MANTYYDPTFNGLFPPPPPQRPRTHSEWLKECLERGQQERFALEVVLTPELAGILLARNDDNRAIRRFKLTEMTRAIEARGWRHNGEPLIVSRCGQLNDGQHRCLAVIKSGVPIPVMIMFGFERETRHSLDQGAARTVSDVISMSGVTGARDMGAAAARVLQYDKDRKMIDDGHSRPERADIVAFVLANQEALARSVELSKYRRNTRLKGAQTSLLASLHYLFCRVSEAEADVFIQRVIDGVGMTPENPIYRLRERLMREPNMLAHNKADLMIRAWRQWRSGAATKSLHASRDPRGPLPEIDG
jgi:hypothetical protein